MLASRITRLVRALGGNCALHFLWQRYTACVRRPGALFCLRSKDANFPLLCRVASSDIHAFHQVFIRREYAIIDELISAKKAGEIQLVLDCGANVGYASSFFLSRFPHCRVIAIEPDPSNFAMLQRNLAPFGRRAQCLRAAVWSHPTRMMMSKANSANGEEWGRQVQEENSDASDSFDAIDIVTLLGQFNESRISVLKMDIEGAEAVVFGNQYTDWLERVDVVLIELHEDTPFGAATSAFKAACRNRFRFEEAGELTAAVRLESNLAALRS